LKTFNVDGRPFIGKNGARIGHGPFEGERRTMIPLSYYVILSAIVFITGLVGVLIRRNIIIILLSVELMLNATNINFVAFSRYLGLVSGQVFVFFALTVAAAEVAVGLAIIIALYRSKATINVDDFQLLKW
jgi:NADH-quinone oxidoreductase subunit K